MITNPWHFTTQAPTGFIWSYVLVATKSWLMGWAQLYAEQKSELSSPLEAFLKISNLSPPNKPSFLGDSQSMTLESKSGRILLRTRTTWLADVEMKRSDWFTDSQWFSLTAITEKILLEFTSNWIFCSTCWPLASTRRVWLTLSSQCPILWAVNKSQQLQEINTWECREPILGLLGKKQVC